MYLIDKNKEDLIRDKRHKNKLTGGVHVPPPQPTSQHHPWRHPKALSLTYVPAVLPAEIHTAFEFTVEN